MTLYLFRCSFSINIHLTDFWTSPFRVLGVLWILTFFWLWHLWDLIKHLFLPEVVLHLFFLFSPLFSRGFLMDWLIFFIFIRLPSVRHGFMQLRLIFHPCPPTSSPSFVLHNIQHVSTLILSFFFVCFCSKKNLIFRISLCLQELFLRSQLIGIYYDITEMIQFLFIYNNNIIILYY